VRVTIVVPSFPKLTETFIVTKFLGLLERGWDMHVVCETTDLADWDRFPDLLRQAGTRHRVHCSWPHRPRWLALLLVPVALFRCIFKNPIGTSQYLLNGWRLIGIDALRRLYLDANLVILKPDIIHFEFGALAFGRKHLKEFLNCRVVVSFRGYDLNHFGVEHDRFFRDIWDQADAIHVLGEDLWRRAMRRGCPADRFHQLIPPAIDANLFNPMNRMHTDFAGTRERPLRILSVGRLEWEKGYEYAIHAIRKLKNQGVCCSYRIVGRGSFLEAIAFAIHQFALDDDVQLLGGLSQAQVVEEMRIADIFLHSAVSEGFCNAVLEAQAMMLPVVCSDAGGLPENVLHTETGFVVPRRYPAALAEKLALLGSDPDMRQRMGLAGRRRVQIHFRLVDQITSFEQLYSRVMQSNAEAGGEADTYICATQVSLTEG